MMRNDGKKKKLLTFVFSLLLIGLYFVIFRFSADDAESSSNLSMRVSEHVVRLYHRLSDRRTGRLFLPQRLRQKA